MEKFYFAYICFESDFYLRREMESIFELKYWITRRVSKDVEIIHA